MINATGTQALEILEEAISRHHALVYRLAFRLVKNHADAEDVVQGVYLQAIRSFGSFSRVTNQRAWLARVAINQALSWLRAEERRRSRERNWAHDPARKHAGEGSMAQEDVERAVEVLPDDLRIPVVLHYQEGLRYREIAEICGCPEGTIARRLHTARERLKKQLTAGGAMGLAAGFEDVLRASPDVSIPAGLKDRIVEEVTRVLTPLPGGGLRTGIAAMAGGSIAKKLGISFLFATAITGAAWYGLERTSQRRPEASEGSRVISTAPVHHAPRGVASLGNQEVRASAEAPLASPEAETAAEARTSPRLFGWVRNGAGHPLAGAKVAIAHGEDGVLGTAVTTDREGYYEFAHVADSGWEWRNLQKAADCTHDGSLPAKKDSAGCADCHRQSSDGLLSKVYRNAVSFDAGSSALLLGEVVEGAGSSAELDPIVVDDARVAQHQLVLDRHLAEAARQYTSNIDLAVSSLELASIKYKYQSSLEAAFSAVSSRPTGPSRLAVNLEGYAAALSEPIEVQDNEPLQVDFRLEAALPLQGLVLSDDGKPVAGAKVQVAAHTGAVILPAEFTEAVTDAAGTFRFESLPAGLYVLRASAQGLLSEEKIARGGRTAVTFHLPLPGAARITVVRKESGEPRSGFSVELRDGERVVAEAVTDEQGEVFLEGVPAGTYLANTFQKSSTSRYSRARVRVDVIRGLETSALLEVDSRIRLEGNVVPAPLGQSPGSIVAEAVPTDGIRRLDGKRKSAIVGEDGSFEIKNLAPGRYLIAVTDTATESLLGLGEVDVFPGRSTVQVEVPLGSQQKAQLEVRIADSRGEPLPAASVIFIREQLERLAGQASSDDSGRVRFEVLPGTFRIAVRASGQRIEVFEDVCLEPGEARSVDLQLELPPAASVGSFTLRDVLRAEPRIAIRDSVTLRAFKDFIAALGLGQLTFAPEIEAAGHPRHLAVSGPRIAAASDLLESALQSSGLGWDPWGRGVRIVRAAP